MHNTTAYKGDKMSNKKEKGLTKEKIQSFMQKDMQDRGNKFKLSLERLKKELRCEIAPIILFDEKGVHKDIKIIPLP